MFNPRKELSNLWLSLWVGRECCLCSGVTRFNSSFKFIISFFKSFKGILSALEYMINISGEESKHGFAPEELDAVLPEIENLDKLQIVGLMTMAPFEASQDELQKIFAATHQLQTELQKKQLKNMPFTELSMGMSRDYDVAIANGATFVRIGTSFFK